MVALAGPLLAFVASSSLLDCSCCFGCVRATAVVVVICQCAGRTSISDAATGQLTWGPPGYFFELGVMG